MFSQPTPRREFALSKRLAIEPVDHDWPDGPRHFCVICTLPSSTTSDWGGWQDRRSVDLNKYDYVHLSTSQIQKLCEECFVRRAACLEYINHLTPDETPLLVTHEEHGLTLHTSSFDQPDIAHTLELVCNDRNRRVPGNLVDTRPFITGDTSDDEAMRWIKGCLATCTSQHRCVSNRPYNSLKASIARTMPTYLLDLGDVDANNPKPSRIRLTRPPHDVKYVCLSYCWGHPSIPSLILQKANLHHISRDGMLWADLPQTFRDVIFLLVQLGYSYLWIDALCIVQDDMQQKQDEIARMAAIFSNSDFVVANVHASAPHDGLFCASEKSRANGYAIQELSTETSPIVVRNLLPHHSYATPTQPISRIVEIDLKFSPLMTRAWTLQELVLAPRVLLFSRWEVLWECRKSRTCQCDWLSSPEDGFAGVNFLLSVGEAPYTPIQKSIIDSGNLQVRRLLLWMDIVKKYSRRCITYEADRNDAFLGIGDKLAAQIGDAVIFGMLENRLHLCMLWITAQTASSAPNSRSPIFPSWSWLSVLGTKGADVGTALSHGHAFEPCLSSVILPARQYAKRPLVRRLRVRTVLYLLPLSYVDKQSLKGVSERSRNDQTSRRLEPVLDEDEFMGSSICQVSQFRSYTLWWDDSEPSFDTLYCMELGISYKSDKARSTPTFEARYPELGTSHENDPPKSSYFLVPRPKDASLRNFTRQGILRIFSSGLWERPNGTLRRFGLE